MAQIEPMDIDIIDSDFDNKENSFHHSNVLPRTPCTEKGYEELDVSELNMKLRYSITPASSPMSKSFTANCLDNRTFDSEEYVNNVVINENGNLTRSLNSTITRTYQDTNKSLKSLPLKVLSTDQKAEDRSASVLRSLDSSLKTEENNVKLSAENYNLDNISLPSVSSSVTQTPEATTPTKEIPKHDGGSPIMRGLKSVLNMFRSSQSPIPPPGSHIDIKSEVLSPSNLALKGSEAPEPEILLASTPIVNKNKEDSRRCSPLKESIVFNDDLERELQWKDETTILFKEEKIPIHKLFLPQSMSSISKTAESITRLSKTEHNYDLNASVEYMDISNNSNYSLSACKTIENIQPTIISNKNEVLAVESDSEFVDCETTLNNDANESNLKEEIILENNENCISTIIQHNDNDCFQGNSKQSIGNNNMITDLLLTDKGKCEEDEMSSLSEIQKQKADMCHEININKIIQTNCELHNTSCGASMENTVDDQSKQALVVKNIFTSTVNEVSTLEDENNVKLVSNEITNQISADKVTQYTKIEETVDEKPETSDSVIMPESVSNKYNYENEYHNEVRLPSDVPLPDDDFEKDIYSVNPDALYPVCDLVSVGEKLTNEHKVMHDLEIKKGIDLSELSVTQVGHSNHNIVNNTELFTAEFTKPYEIGMEHKNQPLHVGKEYYSQTIDISNKITLSEYTEEHKITETTECLQADKVRTENIDNNTFEQGLLESEENKPLVDSQQIFSLETSCLDKNILELKETTFTENKGLENISMGHEGVLESNLCSSKNYIIKTTTNQDSGKLENTVDPSEIGSIHQMGINNCETVLNQKSTGISAMENNFDTNYINATVNAIPQFTSDNVLCSISSTVELTESIDKNQLLEKKQNYSSELQIDHITNVVNNESLKIKEINSDNMLTDSLDVLPTEKFKEDNKVMNSINIVSACPINQKELNFVHEYTKIDEIDDIDIQKNINNLEETDIHSSKTITISPHEVEQAMTISEKEQDKNNFDSLESTEKLKTSNINNFADIVGTPKIRCVYEKNELKSECLRINRNENFSSNKKAIESLDKEVLNTATNNPITSASSEEMSVQATSVANATLNMSIYKEGIYENEDIYIGSESCKDILCEHTDVNEIDPQEKKYSVYHQENERLESSPSKSICIAACDHKYLSNTDITKEEEFCISKDSMEKHIIVCAPSVIEVISQPENITNIEDNISLSNACIPDILNSTNKNLINQNFKNSNEHVKAVEVDVTLQQINTNDMSSQASRSILVGDCQFYKSGNEEGITKILENSSLLNSFANNHNLRPEELNEELENVIVPFNTETKTMQSPPLSPKISSKGYNLNFDEINDPFVKDSKQVMTKILENSSFSVSSDENHIEPEKQKEELENIIEPFATNTKLSVSPPLSPKISSKGYNLNFDDINDPFVKDSKQVMTKILENSSFSVSSGENHMESDEQKEELKNIIEPFATNTKLMVSPPLSPKISSKGYNLNFDEINDPFVKDSKQVMTKILENSSFSVSSGENYMEPDEQKEELENIIEPFATNTKLMASPPLSPKILSKGYNFDESEDPFGIKTKIRMSAPAEGTPTSLPFVGRSSISPKFAKKGLQKLKSLSEKKKQPISEIKRNSTFCSVFDVPEIIENSKNIRAVMTQDLIIGNIPVLTSISNKNIHNPEDVTSSNLPARDNLVESVEVTLCQAEKIVSGTENARTNAGRTESSVNEKDMLSANSYESKNVFNLPEMSSEITFNPFVTKSKVCRSPSPDKESSKKDIFKVPVEVSSHLTRNCHDDDDKNDEDVDNKQTGTVEHDSSIASSSSKATEDATVREVNIEDEDTVEGPFFESDEINNSDKMSDFGTEHDDMMHFSDLPTQGNDDNANENGEMFIDAETFEFLLNQNKSNVVIDSGKESLFLKFDPLFAKRMSSDGVLAALNKVHKRQSTPKRISKVQTVDGTYSNKSSPRPSNSTITTDINNTFEANTEDPNITVSKPMMVVNPAINSIVSPRNKSSTPPRTNRRSLTFTSPAIAVIDRLLSLSGNNSPINHDRTTSEVRREQNETDLALTQLRELLAEKEIHVHNLRSESKELRERLSTLESQVKTLETESEQRLSKVNELNERLAEKTKINKSMAAVVEEYERTIASLIAETEQDKKLHAEERARLINERDEQTAHLASMEISFNDLHSKYEKSKQIILSCKANEDTYKKSIKEFEESLLKMQNNYELLKQHATSKLNHANQELERLNRSHEAEILKLNAMIKRKELHITSLEETLAQKTKANEELTAICDELINKVG